MHYIYFKISNGPASKGQCDKWMCYALLCKPLTFFGSCISRGWLYRLEYVLRMDSQSHFSSCFTSTTTSSRSEPSDSSSLRAPVFSPSSITSFSFLVKNNTMYYHLHVQSVLNKDRELWYT